MMQAFIELNKHETLPQLDTEHSWRLAGICGQSDPDLAFKGDRNKEYEGNPQARARMKALCTDCPIREKCLDDAMTRDERYGIWGALTTAERDAYRPEWEAPQDKAELRARKLRMGSDLSRREHYEDRMHKAREARTRLLQADLEGWEGHLEVLDVLLNSPYTSCGVLAARMGRKRTWFEKRFNEVVERFAGVSS